MCLLLLLDVVSTSSSERVTYVRRCQERPEAQTATADCPPDRGKWHAIASHVKTSRGLGVRRPAKVPGLADATNSGCMKTKTSSVAELLRRGQCSIDWVEVQLVLDTGKAAIIRKAKSLVSCHAREHIGDVIVD